MVNEVPLPEGEAIDLVRESRIHAQDQDTDESVPVLRDDEGRLRVASTVVSEDSDPIDRQDRELGIVDFIREPVTITNDTFDITDREARNLGSVLEIVETVNVDRIGTDIVDDQTASAGVNASVELGDVRQFFDIHYDLEKEGELIIEVSVDGTTWREFDRVTVGGARVRQEATSYAHARVRANTEEFADADINVIEIVSKGE